MNAIVKELVSVLDRQRALRAEGGHFDERARIQNDLHALRATLRRRDEWKELDDVA